MSVWRSRSIGREFNVKTNDTFPRAIRQFVLVRDVDFWHRAAEVAYDVSTGRRGWDVMTAYLGS